MRFCGAGKSGGGRMVDKKETVFDDFARLFTRATAFGWEGGRAGRYFNRLFVRDSISQSDIRVSLPVVFWVSCSIYLYMLTLGTVALGLTALGGCCYVR